MAKAEMDLIFDTTEFNASVNFFQTRFHTSLGILCETAAIKMENYAKENAVWQDRTGNARQLLSGSSRFVSWQMIEIAVSHHVDYGFWLELIQDREYAILEEAIEENVDELYRSIKRFIGGL